MQYPIQKINSGAALFTVLAKHSQKNNFKNQKKFQKQILNSHMCIPQFS
jgi:hypothetical protein